MADVQDDNIVFASQLQQATLVDLELQASHITRPDTAETLDAIANSVSAAGPLELTPERRLKLISAAFCFFNCGINDGSLGALIPYVLRHYDISTGWMAIPYGVSFVGWLMALFVGGYARIGLGSGGVIVAGAALQAVAQALRFWLPPFGLLSVTFFIVSLGQALQEPQANTFVAGLKSAHRYLGVIHASYAIGGLVGPLIAAAIGSNAPGRWAYFYFVPLGIGAINLALCTYAFRDETTIYQKRHPDLSSRLQSSDKRHSAVAFVEFKATMKLKAVWLLSLFFFLYLGAAITAGGWVVEFLAVVRHGSLSRVGYMSSAFYGGLAAGRILLAEPTFRFGEKRMLLAYAVISLALQLVFWRVPNIAVDAVMISFMGFVLGPAFATGVSVGSQLVPVELQPSGLATIFVFAQAGGAIFPAITGVIAATAGVGTLQPILVGLLAAMTASCVFVPNPRKRSA